jgi:Oxidoreductase molybdopterin binding domain
MPSARDLLARPLPAPPDALRLGPFAPGSGLSLDGEPPAPHDARTAALLGRALGTALAVCFVTGLISHYHQHPPDWLDVPSRPVWGYQVTQGLHVISGTAAVPLLLAKLWTVYHRLFSWPPARDVGHALERILLVPLVAGAIFQLLSGLLNIVQWYPWSFFFPRVHYAVAWIVIGSMLVHLAVKWPTVQRVSGRRRVRPTAGSDPGSDGGPHDPPDVAPSADRRAVLIGAGAAVGAVTLATAGQTFAPLRGLSLLAARDPAVGPQHLPVNRTALDAGVRARALDPGWRLRVAGPTALSLSLADLRAMAQHEAVLPIACVEGWSATATWSGVRLGDVLALAGIDADRHVQVVSLEEGSLYSHSPLGPTTAHDPLTLIALRIGGEPLVLDHGYPARLIAPNRPGVQQTKWLSRIDVLT